MDINLKCVSFYHTLERKSLNTRICRGEGYFYKKLQRRRLQLFALDISFVIISLSGIIKGQTGSTVTLCLTYLFTYLLTYLLTPWSRVLLEKLTGSAASQEIPLIVMPTFLKTYIDFRLPRQQIEISFLGIRIVNQYDPCGH